MLVTVVAVGLTCTRLDLASAFSSTTKPAADANSKYTYPWYVINATEKTIEWGQFCKEDTGIFSPIGTRSALEFGRGDWKALNPGDRTSDAFHTDVPTVFNYTSGIIDVDGQLWAPRRHGDYRGNRWYQTSGTEWEHVWIFWDHETDTPFLTREGGGDDIPLARIDSRSGSDNACSR